MKIYLDQVFQNRKTISALLVAVLLILSAVLFQNSHARFVTAQACDPEKDANCSCDKKTGECTLTQCDPKSDAGCTCDEKTGVCTSTGAQCDPNSDKNCTCDEKTGICSDGSNNLNNGNSGSSEICGFAWGATNEPVTPQNGVGWVSFNSKDCDTSGDGTVDSNDTANIACPTGRVNQYSVVKDNTGDLTGYAWSSNLGWLKFGGLSDFPASNGGNNQQNARINGDGTVTGWARFCSGTASGNCSSSDARSDGWDGWVSLRGTAPTYGVSVSGNNFSGYSWGSDVVGWLNWNAGTGNNVHYCSVATQGLVVTLDAAPSSGAATLNTVLTATPALSDGGSTDGISYKFKCDYTDNWSPIQSSSVYTGCRDRHYYSSPGTYYHPLVEGTLGSLVSQGTTEVHVNDNPPPTGDLGATCSVSPKPAFVNQPVTWTVTLSHPGTPPYTYTFDFDDGQADPAPITYPDPRANQSSVNVVRSYPTIGRKDLHVSVTDSTSSATGQCDSLNNVIVRPVIIPI